MSEEEAESLEGAVGPDRRTFIKRLVVGAVFAAPIVSSFTMSGIEAAFGSEPRSTAMASNANTTPQYPTTVKCFTVAGNLLDVTFSSGTDTLRLTVPSVAPFTPALPAGTSICVYRGDLVALQPSVPPGDTPLSAYSVKWDTPTTGLQAPYVNGNSHQNALGNITLRVTTTSTAAGDPIYMIDSGSPVSAGPPADVFGWIVNFVTDPNFVVTQVAPAPPPTTAPPNAAPGTAVQFDPRFAG